MFELSAWSRWDEPTYRSNRSSAGRATRLPPNPVAAC